MAAIIQEGKMSAPGQGGIFQGKSFWLSRQVPGRNNFIRQINVNGGQIVTSEKDANICIVDHLRDCAEKGMYSYRYIEKSLRNGELEDLENHRVKQRTVPGRKPKGLRGRNLFTQEDDEILLNVLCKPGIKLNGNKIYEEIAAEHPNHTMHSWRGRWVDHYSRIMPHGPVPLRKLNKREGEKQEESDEESEKEPEKEVPIKREGDHFSREDEALLKKMAAQLLDDPNNIVNYERLSKKHPHHTPKQWHAYFIKVVLPKIAKEKMAEKPSLKKQIPKSKKVTRSDSEDEEQPMPSTNRDKRSLKTKQEAKMGSGPTPSSPDLERRKPQPPTDKNSPIRIVSVRDPPRSRSKERSKSSTSHKIHKSATDSPTGRATSPTPKIGSKAASKQAIPGSQKPPLARWRAETRKTPTIEDWDSESISASPPTRIRSNLAPNSQKRKRDNSGFTPEQKKKNRNVYEVEEIASTPEPESPTQSRVLSPELGGNGVQSSPPVFKNKDKKQRYAEMSTQALYDQVGDEGSFAEDMEFLKIPSAPPSPAAVSSPPEANSRPKPTPQSKIPALTSTLKSPLSPSTKDDPDGIEKMNAFLAHCRKEYKASEKQVIYAIERTSGIKALVEMVLQSVVDGKQLPVDVLGVWSEEEDKILMGADSREMRKLASRKGDEHTQRRMEFLNLWNMA